MAHWAEIDENDDVLRVVVCDADDDADGTLHPPAFLTDVLGGTWVRTYYSTEGHKFAGVGDRWTGTAFEPPTLPDTAAEEALAAIDLLEEVAVLDPPIADQARERAAALKETP